MDRVLPDRGGLGFVRVPRSVLNAEVVADPFDKSISGLYGDDQLWNLFAPKNSAGFREVVPLGRARVPGAATHYRCYLRHGCAVLESFREAVPEAEPLLRRQASSRRGGWRASAQLSVEEAACRVSGGLQIANFL